MKTEKSSSRAAGRTLARSQVRKQEEYEANRAKGNETNVSLIWMLSEFTPSLQRRAADRKADCVSSVLELTRHALQSLPSLALSDFFFQTPSIGIHTIGAKNILYRPGCFLFQLLAPFRPGLAVENHAPGA